MSAPDVQLHERVAVCEVKIAQLEKERDDRASREQWLIALVVTSLVSVASTIAFVLATVK